MGEKIEKQWIDGRLIPVMDTELANFRGERWKDIPDFDGYQVSSYGRIKSVSRYIHDTREHQYYRSEKIRVLSIRLSKGYINVAVGLTKNDKKYSFVIPRLVYHLFVAEFDLNDHTKIVIRKDRDPLNCHYKNLKLVDPRENIIEGFATKGRKSGFDKKRLPVHQYGTDGVFVRTYSSITEGAKAVGTSVTSICEVTRLKHYRCKGFYWRKGKPQKKINVSKFNAKREGQKNRNRPVQMLSANGKILRTFDSTSAAARSMGVRPMVIFSACNKKKRGQRVLLTI